MFIFVKDLRFELERFGIWRKMGTWDLATIPGDWRVLFHERFGISVKDLIRDLRITAVKKYRGLKAVRWRRTYNSWRTIITQTARVNYKLVGWSIDANISILRDGKWWWRRDNNDCKAVVDVVLIIDRRCLGASLATPVVTATDRYIGGGEQTKLLQRRTVYLYKPSDGLTFRIPPLMSKRTMRIADGGATTFAVEHSNSGIKKVSIRFDSAI